MERKNKRLLGFTMIELLVVLAVISLLLSVAGANYSTSLKRGRDSKRKADMRKVQQSFEQYYTEHQTYAAPCGDMITGHPYYVGPFPPTPPSGVAYDINCASGPPVTYCACADLEIDGTGNAVNNGCDYTTAGSKNFFCVSSLQ